MPWVSYFPADRPLNLILILLHCFYNVSYHRLLGARTKPVRAMEWLFESFSSCFGSLQLDYIQRFLSDSTPWRPEETIRIGRRQFTVLKQIGEGGYSFVYHVREKVTERDYALKKVLIAGPEQLQVAQREVTVLRSLHHPNLLPLLDSAIDNFTEPSSTCNHKHAIHMLFPLYNLGSVFDEVTRQSSKGGSLSPHTAIAIFVQVCRGVAAMHNCRPPLAHRDIKPHNVLLKERESLYPHSHGADTDHDVVEEDCPLQTDVDNAGGFHAVLMDFGSTREARVEISSRAEAVQLQEEAEAQCSAPYRAPELFDVASHCQVDERVDIWSLGCVLYFILYGVSPFEREEMGGSLALAVQNGRVKWPDDTLPAGLRRLVTLCLTTDPAKRPDIKSILSEAEALMFTL